jgi:hypothetical protein
MGARAYVKALVTVWAAAAAFCQVPCPAGGTANCPATALYLKQEGLAATMLATRARYVAWLAEQGASRAAVTLGPWHATGPLRVADADEPGFPEQCVDPRAKGGDGNPLWSQRPGWKDGTVVTLPAQGSTPVATYLCRTISAPKPLTLTVGVGGGDRLELWLDDAKMVTAATSLASKRYGTGFRIEGTRRDQRIVDLRLPAGQSRLLVKVYQASVHARQPYRFYFSPSPDPVPRFWEQLRKDFPPRENRLLEVVQYDWFERDGWFDAPDAHLERRMGARVVESLGEPGDPLGRQLDALVNGDAPHDDPRWLRLCVTAAESSCALEDVGRLRAAVDDLERSYAERYPGEKLRQLLADLEKRLLDFASEAIDPQSSAWRQWVEELAAVRREALVDVNPQLAGARLLFVKRYTYDSRHYYDDYYHGLREFGGNLCELSLGDGTGREAPHQTVREIVPKLSAGIFDRYDLSYDAKRIVFGYRPPRPEGFRIWEVGVDGTGLRQLTFPPEDEPQRVAEHSLHPMETLEANPLLYGHWTDDLHPCYLPDGRIAFASSRPEHSVLCGGYALTCTALYRIDADGTGLHRLSQGALSEFTPTVMDDGRILYNRWEYVYKGIAAVQPLWTMRPDGSGSEEIYGDNVANPGVLVHGRQVPGRPDLVVCTGCGHEPLAVGTIVLLDRHESKRTTEAMTYVTPDTDVRGLRGLYQKRNGRWIADDVYGPFYCDPYPLSDKSFLVACNPERRYNDRSAYGIYLIDVFGNRVRVYDDPEISCWQPRLLKPRRRPPVLAPTSHATVARDDDEPQHATVLVTDVYRGLPGVRSGDVKYLRVMEQIPRSWDATPRSRIDGIPGQQPAVSYHTHIWIAVLLGIVPVETDGSAHFKVPADRNVFFQALDEDFMEIQKMRTFVNFQPGERRSCIGCHEHRIEAPQSRSVLALAHPPVEPGPQPGEVAPRPIHYESDVQPVLDKHCVGCHAGEKPDGDLDLSGELTAHFNRSYENLIKGGFVNFIQEWTGPRLANPPEYFTVGGSMAHAEAVPPYTYGSHKSKLISLLGQGHEDVDLAREEFIRLVTWVDANVPYYGSYFGRRNVQYRNHPAFRPVPTLASARGTPPEPWKADPVPAELVAWWRLDEGSGEIATDASGHGFEARVVRAEWTDDGKLGGALAFDGNGYLGVRGLGRFDAASVAMWVKVDSLTNRWNPLLFSTEGPLGGFHFSLVAEGVPNLALHTGDWNWVHNRAKSAFAPGRWRHLAVVCDPRFGGSLRFYVDGKLDAEAMLDLGLAVDLDDFRLGAWNRWEQAPNNNFHGTLDEVRIYRGSLGDDEVAQLAGQSP